MQKLKRNIPWLFSDIVKRTDTYFHNLEILRKVHKVFVKYSACASRVENRKHGTLFNTGSIICVVKDRSVSIPAEPHRKYLEAWIPENEYCQIVLKTMALLSLEEQEVLADVFLKGIPKTVYTKKYRHKKHLLVSAMLKFAVYYENLDFDRERLGEVRTGYLEWTQRIRRQAKEIHMGTNHMLENLPAVSHTHYSLVHELPSVSREHSNITFLKASHSQDRTFRKLQKLLLGVLYWHENPHIHPDALLTFQKQIGQGAPFIKSAILHKEKQVIM